MDTKASNFFVGSRGYCFLCMNKIASQITQVKPGDTLDNSPPSVYSLQDISRYMKFDMRKVFIDEGPVPPQLLAQVEKSRLKVELCESCGSLTDNVSKLCRQLEKLKLEVESGLELIHRKMFGANQSGLTEEFRKAVGSELSRGMGDWMEILEALRMEAMQKCSHKMNMASPRLRIQRLTSKEIHKRTFRNLRKATETSLERTTNVDQGLQCNINIAKTEELDNAAYDLALDDDDCNGVSFAHDSNDDADDSISTLIKGEDGESTKRPVTPCPPTRKKETSTSSTRNYLQRKWIINPETKKYKCLLCAMEYGSQAGVQLHYSTVHRKVRFKCKICGKEFTQQVSYKRHHESVHMGIRFQCKVCKKTFSQKHLLVTHQRKTECAIRVKQNVQ